jgi:hypothetical protein
VSDISLGPGIGVFAGALLTLAVGAVFLVTGVVVGFATRLQSGERRSARILRCCAAAFVCLAVGALFFGLASICGPQALRRLDDWTLEIPVMGLGLGLTTVVALAIARRARRRAARPSP